MTLKGLVRVRSNYIFSLGYRNGEATVRFTSGLVRNYRMPVRTFQEWMAAPSIGRFFNARVKRSKPVRKISRPPIVPRGHESRRPISLLSGVSDT